MPSELRLALSSAWASGERTGGVRRPCLIRRFGVHVWGLGFSLSAFRALFAGVSLLEFRVQTWVSCGVAF